MNTAQKHLAILMLLFSCAAAQRTSGPMSVQRVTAVREGSDLRVEVTLSGPVNDPSVETAIEPDRILIDLPGTTCNACTQTVPVNTDGIRRVRTGQHSTSPMVTRVVVDLDAARPYTLKTIGNRVILTVGPSENAGKTLHGAPVAATTGNLMGVFHRKKESAPPPVVDDRAGVPAPAPPPLPAGPAFEPSSANASASSFPAPPPAVIPAQPASAPSSANASASSLRAPPRAVTPAQPVSVPSPEKPVRVAAQNSAPQPAQGQSPMATSTLPAVSASAAKPTASPSEGTVESVAAEPIVAEATPPKNEPVAPSSAAPAAGSSAAKTTSSASAPVASVPPAAPAPVAPATAVAPTEIAAGAKNEASAGTATAGPPAASDSVVSASEIESTGATAAASAPEGNAATLIARSDDPSLHTVFRVKYVAEGVAYLDGGRTQGLTEGMKLEVEDKNVPARQGDSVHKSDPRIVAELEVTAVADTSAVTDIHAPKRPVKVGDLAYLSSGDAESLVQQRALSATRQYPAVISFTEGDTLDEEVRADVPRPPMPSVNRARGRLGFDTIETFSHGTSSVTSTDVGVVFRGDITRIGGTYWNLSGYWRGQLTKESVAAQQTLQETLNRTYHLNMTYDNPNSSLVAGFGRLYLPWAPSLDTIDGGYFGDRLSKGTVLGIFGGSTPDPSSWDYRPDRAIGGAFINFEGGEYNGLHYSATTGAGMSFLKWTPDDPFVFVEDSISYKRDIAIYESAQFDRPKGNTQTPSPGPGLGRNFFTLRVNPHPRLELDANYNYFRQIPTFDPTLIGTGLLDKYLFQGFSVGARLEIFNQLWISTTQGRSSGSGDAKSSRNQMYGITYNRMPWLGVRADLRYSRFGSGFGTGSYDALSLSRQVNDRLRLEVLLGQQVFASPITANTHSRFLTGTIETTLGPHYYLQSNFTTNRGDLSYDQLMFSMGYRFDSKRGRE
jgi:hypothetical protein